MFDVNARSLIGLDGFELKFSVHLLHDLSTIERISSAALAFLLLASRLVLLDNERISVQPPHSNIWFHFRTLLEDLLLPVGI